jgi:glycosyltransferase involved in cell wall biosynthesis
VKSLRVAYVVNVFPKLSETFIAHELAELRRRGIELRVFPLRPAVENCAHGFITEASLETLTCRDPARLESELDAFGPRLLHAHFATEPAGRRAAMVPAPRGAVHLHRARLRHPAEAAAGFRGARRGGSRLVTVSEANRRHIVETFGVPERHIRVIPCGVDTESLRAAVRGRGEVRRGPGPPLRGPAREGEKHRASPGGVRAAA